jgi:hypothetical protein
MSVQAIGYLIGDRRSGVRTSLGELAFERVKRQETSGGLFLLNGLRHDDGRALWASPALSRLQGG